ncbi:MAG: aminotransferase class IV [Halobacteriota archaeon]
MAIDESELIAWHDGEYQPLSEATVPIDDAGFRWGYNVYDLLITLEHEPHQLDAHVERTFDSCAAANMRLGLGRDELADVVRSVVDRNVDAIGPDDDLMVFISVSGGYRIYDGEYESPRLIVSARPTPCERFARDFLHGKPFVTASTRQLSSDTLSPNIKHRSRMHFVLATMEARRVDPEADPILLDHAGNVTETAIGNVFVVTDGVVRTPPLEAALPGITRETTLELARERSIPVREEQLQPYDLYTADEVFWTNTSHVVAPITSVDGREIGDGRPGPVAAELLDAHSERAGVDIVERYMRHLPADERPEQLRLGGDDGVRS